MTSFQKIFASVGIAAFVVFIFIGVGLINQKNFQQRAKLESKTLLKEYFSNKSETLRQVNPPDYSLDQIELGAVTDNNSYYIILAVENSYFETHTALNFLVKPRLKIIHVESRKKKT